jgi:Nucleotide-sugar transporter
MSNTAPGGSALPLSKENAFSNLKSAVLATLVVQNSALALFMKYSRSHTGTRPLYAATTAVVCAESVKVAVSLLLQAKVHNGVMMDP